MTRYVVTATSDSSSRQVQIKRDEELVFTEQSELAGQEIVNSLRNADGTVLFELHKPVRGWYLAIRSSASDSFVQLKPARHAMQLAFTIDSSFFDSCASSKPKQATFLLQPLDESRSWLSALSSLFGSTSRSFTLTYLTGDSNEEMLRYVGKSSILSVNSNGELLVKEALVEETGAPLAFFVSAALAFLEYQQDAEAYRAAQEDLVD